MCVEYLRTKIRHFAFYTPPWLVSSPTIGSLSTTVPPWRHCGDAAEHCRAASFQCLHWWRSNLTWLTPGLSSRSEVSCCVWHCAEEEETKKLRRWIKCIVMKLQVIPEIVELVASHERMFISCRSALL